MSIRMGRMLNIPIDIHFTLLIAFLLIAGTLAVGFMPIEYPGLPQIAYVTMGALGAVLLFVSVLIHELAHSYVAVRNGLKVRRIVLFIFGGVSEITDEPKNPSLEFRLAFAGPLTSFVLGGILAALWYITSVSGLNIILEAALRYGGLINILLGVFNLVPAFPMDGGRVLRAGIWKMLRDRHRATLIASRVGIAFAYVFIAFGLIITFTGSLLAGIWFIFIGWFLKSAAESGLSQTMVSEALSAMKVGDIMTEAVHTVGPDLTLKDIIENHFLVHKHGGFPVVSNGSVLGIITLGDVKKVPKEKWEQIKCKDMMTTSDKLIFVRRQDSATDVFLLMSTHNVGRLIVLDDKKLAGIISRSDLTKTIRTRASLAK